MKIVAIVQARMGSTRLPGKVLMDIAGGSMLSRVVSRLRRVSVLNGVVVATTVEPEDLDIVKEAERIDAAVFRGSQVDVLDRYVRAARGCHADAIVRITSDCPLIDPGVVGEIVETFVAARPAVDYCANTLERTYPRGLDAEVIDSEALEQAGRDARAPYEREHVTPYLYQHPEIFRLVSVRNNEDYSRFRWTVDVSEDLALVRAIYDRLGSLDTFTWRDVVALLGRDPHLLALNAHVEQKSVPGVHPLR